MQNYTQKQGCFVYRLTDENGIGVRNSLNVGDDNRVDGTIFYENDLVSVDLICPSKKGSGSTNGPFLRLTDKSGWLFEKKYGDVVAEEVRVEKGLWAFYVDNVPDGAMLQANPFTRVPKQSYYATKYHPMQLLYFDRRVVSPSSNIASYRVQGTDGWIAESDALTGDEILLPECKVKVGMFAYEVSSGSDPISLYKQPSVGPDTKLPVSFASGEIVIVDVIRQSPKNHPYNGPFLRLADGLGWMYEQMGDTSGERMNQLPIEKGCWTFRVMNSPAGIAMRRHPMDEGDVKTLTLFSPDDVVCCDRRIKSSSSPTTFYRVTGTDGWVFDVRNEHVMMSLISSQPLPEEDSQPSVVGWGIGFIRGLALAFDLKEISHNETSRVISFRTEANIRINVYYTTRTVGTALEHPTQGATQFFRRGCSDDELKEIMSNPRVHTGKGYKKRKRNEQINDDNEVEVLETNNKWRRTLSNNYITTSTSTSAQNSNDDNELQILGTTNEQKLPHSRHDCIDFPYQENNADINSKFCELCYCYVCDDKAINCNYWYRGTKGKCCRKDNGGKSEESNDERGGRVNGRDLTLPEFNHCNATNKGPHAAVWARLRQVQQGYKKDAAEAEYIEEEEYYRNKVIEYEKEEDKITTKKAQALAVLKSIDIKRANNVAKMDSKIQARTEEFEQKRREEEAAAREREERARIELVEAARLYAESQTFSCTYCSRTFSNQRSLNQHKISTRHW